MPDHRGRPLNLEPGFQEAEADNHIRFRVRGVAVLHHHRSKCLMGGLYEQVFGRRADRQRTKPTTPVEILSLGFGERRIDLDSGCQGKRRSEVRKCLSREAGLDSVAAAER